MTDPHPKRIVSYSDAVAGPKTISNRNSLLLPLLLIPIILPIGINISVAIDYADIDEGVGTEVSD